MPSSVSRCADCRRPSQALASYMGVRYCAGCLANRATALRARVAARSAERDCLWSDYHLLRRELALRESLERELTDTRDENAELRAALEQVKEERDSLADTLNWRAPSAREEAD